MFKDKKLEHDRYDKRAHFILKSTQYNDIRYGSKSLPLIHQEPYIFYEKKVKELIKPNFKVLEIGSGSGTHTYSLLSTGAKVIASDISKNCLSLIKKRYSITKYSKNLTTIKADIEYLPFENNQFDVVTSAGCLSYGSKNQIDNEIKRVIKPSGYFICVDSLNNNLVYKYYRLLQLITGSRTKMTYLNMPDIKRLNKVRKMYSFSEVKFFGSVMYLGRILSLFLSLEKASNFVSYSDRLIKPSSSAYKFVLVTKK